ncbi:MAG: P-loop NTPase [Magnetococcus sp. DMHC-6]
MIDDLDNQVATLKELVRKVAENEATGSFLDQNEPPSLRKEIGSPRKVPHTIAVTSGKGGVGKTLVSVNLAVDFAKQGLKVLIVDADLGLANVDVVLGLTPKYTIQDVLDDKMTLDEVAITGPYGITILPAASGVAELSTLTEGQRLALMDHMDHWNADYDVVLVDTGAGISSNVRFFVLAVERILVVATPDPASITDAYAVMKVLFMNHHVSHFDLVVNQVRSDSEGLEVYRTLNRVTDRFLNIALHYVGDIPYDPQLVQCIRQQKPVVDLFPDAISSLAFKELSNKLRKEWGQKRQNVGRMTFFWRRLLEESASSANLPAFCPSVK